MHEKDWLDIAMAVGSIATPLLILGLTAVGSRIKRRFERRFELEDRLRSDRIEIYNDVLEPYILGLTSDAVWESDPSTKGKNKEQHMVKTMLSLTYRKKVFQLSLIASDDVVIAYNNLMQHAFSTAGETSHQAEESGKRTIMLMGAFLLEVRKSMGNETTKLDQIDMLESFITDARTFR